MKHKMQLTTTIIALFIFQIQHLEADKNIEDLIKLYNEFSKTATPQKSSEENFQVPDWKHWAKRAVTYPVKKSKAREYDFIIVGSGSAGSVIANRLSEVPHWRILLLEAGEVENILTRVPVIAPAFQFTHYDWHYYMEYQKGLSMGIRNDRMYWPRGRALGGTSVINYMIYTRGSPYDFQRWQDAGNPGWGPQDAIYYYTKSENASIREADYRYHNTEGYLTVQNTYQTPMVEAFIRGGSELGLPLFDYNSMQVPFGVARIQSTTINGERMSTARAFLEPIRHRKNLDIITKAYVTKVLIDPKTKQAYGVKYESNGKKYVVKASKEVVLSAGAFNSPQLLMLAGIGPEKHLRELGIPVLQDLPVGQNLHDHLCFPGMAFEIDLDLTISIQKTLRINTIKEYITNGTGMVTSLGGAEGIGYIKTEVSKEVEDIPDIELLFIGGNLASDNGIITRRGMHIKDEVYNHIFSHLHGKPAWTIFPMLLHPKSTGYMKLVSRNPYDYPKFYGNFFTDPEEQDLRTFVAAVRVMQRLSDTQTFQQLGSRLGSKADPNCKGYPFDSDEYWKCAVRSLAVTLHHQVGTAKMGPASDPGAVVNPELRVYGVNGLRVADCSVIPFAISAHTNAPSMMVGEKASDLIKAFWGET